MQLFVVIIIMPWLVLLGQTRWYKYVRVTGASLAGVAALAWMTERISGGTNAITTAVQKLSLYAVWGVAGLAFFSLVIYLLDKKNIIYLIKRNDDPY